jgi:hypothetical protein
MTDELTGLLGVDRTVAAPAVSKAWTTKTADEIVADLTWVIDNVNANPAEWRGPRSGAIDFVTLARGIPFVGHWRALYPRRVQIRAARRARKQRRGWA